MGYLDRFCRFLTQEYKGQEVGRAFLAFYTANLRAMPDGKSFTWRVFYSFYFYLQSSKELLTIRLAIEKVAEGDRLRGKAQGRISDLENFSQPKEGGGDDIGRYLQLDGTKGVRFFTFIRETILRQYCREDRLQALMKAQAVDSAGLSESLGFDFAKYSVVSLDDIFVSTRDLSQVIVAIFGNGEKMIQKTRLIERIQQIAEKGDFDRDSETSDEYYQYPKSERGISAGELAYLLVADMLQKDDNKAREAKRRAVSKMADKENINNFNKLNSMKGKKTAVSEKFRFMERSGNTSPLKARLSNKSSRVGSRTISRDTSPVKGGIYIRDSSRAMRHTEFVDPEEIVYERDSKKSVSTALKRNQPLRSIRVKGSVSPSKSPFSRLKPSPSPNRLSSKRPPSSSLCHGGSSLPPKRPIRSKTPQTSSTNIQPIHSKSRLPKPTSSVSLRGSSAKPSSSSASRLKETSSSLKQTQAYLAHASLRVEPLLDASLGLIVKGKHDFCQLSRYAQDMRESLLGLIGVLKAHRKEGHMVKEIGSLLSLYGEKGESSGLRIDHRRRERRERMERQVRKIRQRVGYDYEGGEGWKGWDRRLDVTDKQAGVDIKEEINKEKIAIVNRYFDRGTSADLLSKPNKTFL